MTTPRRRARAVPATDPRTGAAEFVFAAAGGAAPGVADAALRRARAHADAGHLLSAIVDAQRAVLSAGTRAARVLALAAQVQFDIGADPDLVVAAADHALRCFAAGPGPVGTADRARCEVAGGPSWVRGADLTAFQVAATLSDRIHTAFGRTGPASAASRLAPAGAGPARSVRTWPTLAALLAERGHDRRRPALAVRPAPPVPALRADPRHRATTGDLLAGLRDGSDPDADLMLALEAHALFAAAVDGGDIDMRHQFGRPGRVWADLLLGLGRRARRDGLPLAVDAARWLDGVLGPLAPYATVDAAAGATTIAARRWLREVGEPVGYAHSSAG